jgi:minor histocompatibility antigen H13
MAGGVLVGLFLLLKYLPDGWVNLLLRPYFLVVCGFAAGDVLSWLLEALARAVNPKYHSRPVVTLPFGMGHLSSMGVVGLLLGLGLSSLELYLRMTQSPLHWIVNNIVGLTICLEAVGKLSVGSFSTGSMLLVSVVVLAAVAFVETPEACRLPCSCMTS